MTRRELSQKVDEFVTKYQGKIKGYPNDSSYQGECLSIVKIYIKEIFGFNPPASGSNSAYGYWSNFPNPLSSYFNKIERKNGIIPKKGDIPIWKTTVGNGFGHIDIAIKDITNTSFIGFDQNWGGKMAHLQSHSYNDIVGWLEPKLTENSGTEGPESNMKLEELLLKYNVKTIEELDSKIFEHCGTTWGSALDSPNGYLGAARNEITQLKMDLEACKQGSAQSLPATLTVNNEIWGLNGVNLVDGKLQGNYKRN